MKFVGRELTCIDKSNWPDGPWKDEPDRIDWQDKRTTLHCLMLRGPVGAWCGYVGVEDGHPLHGVGYEKITGHYRVHGGINFSSFSQGDPDDPSNPLVIAPARNAQHPGRVWWFGFDCSHAFDYSPLLPHFRSFTGSEMVYRDVIYVREQVAQLAAQMMPSNPLLERARKLIEAAKEKVKQLGVKPVGEVGHAGSIAE